MTREDCKVGDVLAMPDEYGKPHFMRVLRIDEDGPLMQPITRLEAGLELRNMAEAKRLGQLCAVRRGT